MSRNLRAAYREYVKSLLANHPLSVAITAGVGGDFEPIGILQRELLIQHGLKRDGYLIDIGCGAGRLTKALADYLSGDYLGLDIVPEFIEYARHLASRPHWRFELVEGLEIPEVDGRADMVCLFSVLTHLFHEDAYVYLREARRVLKPTGKIVLSFLEFSVESLWPVFEASIVKMSDASYPLTMFMSRDMISAWASHLALKVETFEDGDKPHIPLPNPVVFDSGFVMEGRGFLGQSICVLSTE